MNAESIALLFTDVYADVESGEDESDTSMNETQSTAVSGADENSDDDAVNWIDVELRNQQKRTISPLRQ